MKNDKSKISLFSWYYVQRIGVFVAIIASIGTVIGVWYQVKETKIEAQFQILSSELITAPADIQELSSIFIFKGDTIKNMYRMKCRFVNTGDKTLIGQGSQQNILSHIELAFPTSVKILDRLLVTNESSLPFTIETIDGSNFKLKFSQWKRGESATILFFLKTENTFESLPLPVVMDRPIIDGKLIVRDLSTMVEVPATTLLDSITPRVVSQAVRVTIIVTSIILCLICLLIIVIVIHNEIKVYNWKKENLERVRYFYESKGLSKLEIMAHLNSISLDPKQFKDWKEANIEIPPNITTANTKTTYALLTFLLFLVVVFLSSALSSWVI